MARWDYSGPGSYFITVCTQDREPLLATPTEGELILTRIGVVVAETWEWLGTDGHVTLDEWCVMPDHLHGIIILWSPRSGGSRQGTSRSAPTTSGVGMGTGGDTLDAGALPKSLGRLIGAFKTKSTNAVNRLRGTPGEPLWQRNFYEHIIRDEADMNRIRQYIKSNVVGAVREPP